MGKKKLGISDRPIQYSAMLHFRTQSAYANCFLCEAALRFRYQLKRFEMPAPFISVCIRRHLDLIYVE